VLSVPRKGVLHGYRVDHPSLAVPADPHGAEGALQVPHGEDVRIAVSLQDPVLARALAPEERVGGRDPGLASELRDDGASGAILSSLYLRRSVSGSGPSAFPWNRFLNSFQTVANLIPAGLSNRSRMTKGSGMAAIVAAATPSRRRLY